MIMNAKRKRKIFVFGSSNDPHAWFIADKLAEDFPSMEFVKTEDPFVIHGEKDVVIVDVVKGIKEPCTLSEDDIKKRRISTLHDLDLGFVINLLKTMKEIKNLKILGIPFDADVEEVKKFLAKVLR